MLKCMLLVASLACGFIIVNGIGEKMLGPGKWFIINLMKCEEDESMLLKFEVSRRKINRTHDGFNAKLKLDEVLDGSYAIRIEICKYVDGGCKPYQTMADNSAEAFIKKYSKENLVRMLSMASIDPPDFPIPIGLYEVYNYIFDYEQLPTDGQYGKYCAIAFLVKDGLDKACLKIVLEFTEEEEE